MVGVLRHKATGRRRRGETHIYRRGEEVGGGWFRDFSGYTA